jgi:hypothetical protein
MEPFMKTITHRFAFALCAGAGKDISTTTLQGDVYGYIFDQKGRVASRCKA